LRHASNGALVRTIRDKSGINSLSFTPDGSLIAEGRTNGSSGGNLKIYRVADGTLVFALSGHSNSTRAVAFAPSGAQLASGGDDRLIKLWQVSSGAFVRSITVGSRLRRIAYAADGLTIASGDQVGGVKLWRVSDGAAVRTFTGLTSGVTGLAFSPDRTLLAASSLDGTVRVWRASDASLVRRLALPGSTPNGSSTALAFTPDGKTLAVGNDEVAPLPEHGTLRFYRVSDWAQTRLVDQQTDVYVSSIAFSPTAGTYAYTRAIDGVLTVATLGATAAPAASLSAPERTDRELAFALSPNHPEPFRGQTRLTLTLARDAYVQVAVYDAAGRVVASLQRGPLSAGTHDLVWNGTAADGATAPAGVYFCRAAAGGASATRKMVLVTN
jgi:WD40 repeat protein